MQHFQCNEMGASTNIALICRLFLQFTVITSLPTYFIYLLFIGTTAKPTIRKHVHTHTHTYSHARTFTFGGK